jgi:hypothetical protein
MMECQNLAISVGEATSASCNSLKACPVLYFNISGYIADVFTYVQEEPLDASTRRVVS